jgi:glycerol-3-phosphate dehydrogenase (NAD(P)+)
MTSESEPPPAGRSSRTRSLSPPGARRATVIGAGSFGTALAVLLARGGLRTTLQTRTAEQATLIDREHTLKGARENRRYLPGVELPSQLRIEPASAGVARADYVFLAVPSRGLGEVIESLAASGLGNRTAVVSVAKGLVPPHGTPPTRVLGERFGAERVACVGGPAHAQEMVHARTRPGVHAGGGCVRAVQ